MKNTSLGFFFSGMLLILAFTFLRCLAGVSREQEEWLCGSFAKICLQAADLKELMEVHDKAYAAGLDVHLITDSGLTEFRGIATVTCLAIGPHEADKIDPITGHLKLY